LEQSAWIYEGEILFDVIAFYNDMTNVVDWRRAVDIGYFNFNKAFDIVPSNIPIDKLTR